MLLGFFEKSAGECQILRKQCMFGESDTGCGIKNEESMQLRQFLLKYTTHIK